MDDEIENVISEYAGAADHIVERQACLNHGP
jgi:hypothetical protein